MKKEGHRVLLLFFFQTAKIAKINDKRHRNSLKIESLCRLSDIHGILSHENRIVF